MNGEKKRYNPCVDLLLEAGGHELRGFEAGASAAQAGSAFGIRGRGTRNRGKTSASTSFGPERGR